MTKSGKRNVAVVIVLLALLAGVAFAVYLLTRPDPAANLQRAEVGEAREEPAATQADAATDVVVPFAASPDGAGNVELEFTGSSALGEQPGFFQSITGEAVVGEGGALKALRGTVDLSSVLTNADRLTNNLKTAPGFFEVDKFPTAKFVSTDIAAAAGAGGATHLIRGNLTLRDQTKSISFPATVSVTADAVKVDAEFSVNRRDFGVTYEGGTAFPEIRDLVRIRLSIDAPRPAAGAGGDAPAPSTGPAAR